MIIQGTKFPNYLELLSFIQTSPIFKNRAEKDAACLHAWQMYLELIRIYVLNIDSAGYDVLRTAALAMMGAHFAYSDPKVG